MKNPHQNHFALRAGKDTDYTLGSGKENADIKPEISLWLIRLHVAHLVRRFRIGPLEKYYRIIPD